MTQLYRLKNGNDEHSPDHVSAVCAAATRGTALTIAVGNIQFNPVTAQTLGTVQRLVSSLYKGTGRFSGLVE
jgi:hypothetical protein